MIVPRDRLIFGAAVVLVPGALVLAVSPAHVVTVLCGWLAFLLLLAIDATLAPGRLAGIRAAFPDTVRMTKEREGVIPVHLANERACARTLRLGLSLPRAIASPEESQLTRLPQGVPEVRLDWPCTPHKRGRFPINRVYISMASPLGFWDFRKVLEGRTELRVYPNLQGERRRLAAIFLNRGNLGIHAQRRLGKGRDFEQLREYIPGDSFEDIHWKATARRARPVTKVYQIERTQEIYVAIDASRLSARTAPDDAEGVPGGGLTSQLERFITAALVLGMVAEKQGDLFGLLTFSDRVHGFVRARNGKAHYNVCRETLYSLETQPVNPDFEELFSFVRQRLRRRALLIILTNLDDPVLAQHFTRNLDVVTRRHLVLVNMITPPGVRPLFSRDGVKTPDDIYRHLAGHLRWHDLRELQRALQRRGVPLSLLDNAALTPELVSQYVNVKQRQVL